MKEYSAIKEMFYGNRGTSEHIAPTKNYQEMLAEFVKKQDKLYEGLKKFPKLLELYNELENLSDALETENVDNYYSEGFRFGVLMGLDVVKEARRE